MKSGKTQRSSRMPVARRLGFALAAIAWTMLTPAGNAFAQGTESPLALSREAYDAAIDVWVALQQNLAEEMRTLPADAARNKLQAAEKARQAVARTRLSYLTSLSQAYADFAAGLRAVASAPDSAAGQLLSADKAMLSDLDAAVALLDSDIKTAAAADRPRVAALQKQKTDLLELRSLALRRGRELDRLESVRKLAKERRESLAKSYTRLSEWASAVAEAAAKEEESWAAAYTAMLGEISNLPRERVVRRPAPETAPPSTPPVQIAAAPAQAGGSVLVPSIGEIGRASCRETVC